MLQSHYRSTLDLSDEALQAAEKGYRRLMEANKTLSKLITNNEKIGDLDKEITNLIDTAFADMDDDFNTPKALASLFELSSKINALKGGQLSLNDLAISTLNILKKAFNDLIFDIFGLLDETTTTSNSETNVVDGLMQLVLDMRADARTKKDWAMSDKVRDALAALKIQVKDTKEGTSWTIE